MEIWKNLLRDAYVAATHSPDPSTQNGALIVSMPQTSGLTSGAYQILGSDCNRFPKNVLSTPAHWNDRQVKYKRVHHAERTVLGTVRRLHGLSHFDGKTMVCPWAACSNCAQEIIEEGISRLVTHKQAHERGLEAERRAMKSGATDRMAWAEDIQEAYKMFREAGVEIVEFDGKVDGPQVLHGGQLWTP